MEFVDKSKTFSASGQSSFKELMKALGDLGGLTEQSLNSIESSRRNGNNVSIGENSHGSLYNCTLKWNEMITLLRKSNPKVASGWETAVNLMIDLEKELKKALTRFQTDAMNFAVDAQMLDDEYDIAVERANSSAEEIRKRLAELGN